jgi:hypothetical protein
MGEELQEMFQITTLFIACPIHKMHMHKYNKEFV